MSRSRPRPPTKVPVLKPLARGGYGAPVRAGRYPDDYADESKRGAEIQFRLRLVTKESSPDGSIPERVQRCYERLLAMRDRLVAASRGLEAEQFMRDAALHVDSPEHFEAALGVAEMVTALPAAVERHEWTTWGDVAHAWTSGALRRRFPGKQIKEKESTSKDEGIVRWLEPFIGNVPLETFTEDHYDRAMGNLPARVQADGAKRHYATVIMRVMRLARQCRLVTNWHLDGVTVWKVEKKNRKVFTCLFPSDLDQLLPCGELEYRWRLLWGFMVFESPRIGYLPFVTWDDIETDGTGGIGMDSKSGEWLSWDLRPGTLEALLHMREIYPELPGPFAWVEPSKMRLAETLREHLVTAGALDARLHTNEGRRRRMRAHDLRATFVVFAKIEGRSEDWIMDRTGHTTSEMVQRYDRMERKARGKGWRPLGRLDEALGLGALAPGGRALPHAPAPPALPPGPSSDVAPGVDVAIIETTGEASDGDPSGSDRTSGSPVPRRRDGSERVTDSAPAHESRPHDGCAERGHTHTVTDTVTRAVTFPSQNRVGRSRKGGHMREKTATYDSVPMPGFEPGSRDSKTRDWQQELGKSAETASRDAPQAAGSDHSSRAAVTPRAAYAAALKRAMAAAVEAEALDHLPELTRLFEAATSAAGGAKVVELALHRGLGK